MSRSNSSRGDLVNTIHSPHPLPPLPSQRRGPLQCSVAENVRSIGAASPAGPLLRRWWRPFTQRPPSATPRMPSPNLPTHPRRRLPTPSTFLLRPGWNSPRPTWRCWWEPIRDQRPGRGEPSPECRHASRPRRPLRRRVGIPCSARDGVEEGEEEVWREVRRWWEGREGEEVVEAFVELWRDPERLKLVQQRHSQLRRVNRRVIRPNEESSSALLTCGSHHYAGHDEGGVVAGNLEPAPPLGGVKVLPVEDHVEPSGEESV